MDAGLDNLKHKVFVTNFAGHDFKPAEVYGELVPITQGYVSFQSLDRLKFIITEAVSASTPDDYLLMSGTAIVCVVAALAWMEKHKVVKLLNWDKKGREYRVLEVKQETLQKILQTIAGG